MKIDRILYVTTLVCVVLNRALIVYDNYQHLKQRDMFRQLSPEEEKDFRQWARDNYRSGEPISSAWHPVVQDECRLINEGRTING